MDMMVTNELIEQQQQQHDFLSMTSSVAASDMTSITSSGTLRAPAAPTLSCPATGPMSLGSHLSNQSQLRAGAPTSSSKLSSGIRTQTYLPSLETNLLKILARKIQDSEEVSFRKSKLLTMAYYKLLRETPQPILDPQIQVTLYQCT